MRCFGALGMQLVLEKEIITSFLMYLSQNSEDGFSGNCFNSLLSPPSHRLHPTQIQTRYFQNKVFTIALKSSPYYYIS